MGDAIPLDGGGAADAQANDADRPDAMLASDACPCDVADLTRGPVYTFGPCVPPLEHGCLARSCDTDDDCGDGFSCEPCAAAACCACSDCRSACLRTHHFGPLPDLLKLEPTFGPSGTEQDITVEGAPFPFGALFHNVRIGDLDPVPGAEGRCQLVVRAPAHPQGLAPVWVSQYGGREPWVLAGFFRFGGEAPAACVQPGFPCGPEPCCETEAVPMACTAGRCRQR